MNMLRAFKELSELHEAWLPREILIKKIRSTGRHYDFSKYTDAQLYRIWDRIRTERIKKTTKAPAHELDLDFESVEEHDYCVCGARLSDAGFCPVCDGGEEDYTEALEEAGNLQSKFANNIDADIITGLESEAPVDPIIGGMTKCSKSAPLNALYYVSKGENVKFKLGNIKLPFRQITHCWVEHNGKVAQTRNDANAELITKFSVDLVPSDIKASKKRIIDLIKAINDGSLAEGILDSKPSFTSWVKMQPSVINTPSHSQSQATSRSATPPTSASTGKYIVTIVSDNGRLRAHATDGVHPGGWVVFPNNLRQFDGQQYEVDQLIWNGKNYRVSGNIKAITTPNLTASSYKTHPNSGLVMDNYDNNLSYHISELEDEGDAEDSVEYFERFPDILEVIQSGSDIIFKLSSIPEDDDVIYWILTYSLGNVGNDIAENGRYSARAAEIIISEADFTNALNNNLN